MIPPKNIRTFQFQPQMGLYEESRGLVVICKAQRLMHKYSSIPVMLCSICQIYKLIIFMSMKDAFVVFFHTLMVECYKFTTRAQILSQFQIDFLYRFGLKGSQFWNFEFLETVIKRTVNNKQFQTLHNSVPIILVNRYLYT